MCSSRAPASRCVVTASSKKTDIRKQGLESIKDDVVKANLMGVSRKMDKKGWVDAQGRKGKVLSCSPPAFLLSVASASHGVPYMCLAGTAC